MLILFIPLVMLLSLYFYFRWLQNVRERKLLSLSVLILFLIIIFSIIYLKNPTPLIALILGFILIVIEFHINNKYLALTFITIGMCLIIYSTYEFGKIHLANNKLLTYIFIIVIAYMLSMPYFYKRLKENIMPKVDEE